LKTLYVYFVIILIFSNLFAKEIKPIKIGVYQNEPKIFFNQQNQASGFHIDIINEIAQKEHWLIEYIPCQWSECIQMLTENKIDILPDIAYSEERAKRFIFSNETIFSSWSYVYTRKNINLKSLLDLENKTIAVLKESIQYDSIKKLLHQYDINGVTYEEVNEWNEAFDLVIKKKVDALIVNRFYELNNTIDPTIKKTDIVIMPVMVKYGFSTLRQNLIPIIDSHLKSMKNDKSSVYYQAQNKWLTKKEEHSLPTWVKWTFIIVIAIIFILLIVIVLFKRLVNKKTHELLKKEQIILMQSRQATIGEMIGNIAHQWKQPLSIISMQSSLIEANLELGNEISSDNLRECTKDVSNQVEYLSRTIDDFRDYLKPHKHKTTVSILSLFDNLKKLIGKSLSNHNIELQIGVDNEFKMTLLANELLQVLINIINNAKDIIVENKIKEGKIIIQAYETNDCYCIKILDNGGGIPEEIIDKIGDLYYTTKSDDKGTGLGLYMSKSIVESLNGKLTWENVANQASFNIVLMKN